MKDVFINGQEMPIAVNGSWPACNIGHVASNTNFDLPVEALGIGNVNLKLPSWAMPWVTAQCDSQVLSQLLTPSHHICVLMAIKTI
jgi:hypothetical protein